MHHFYSDTQTRPSRAMREAMLDAPVGDERHDDDPTTLALCERVADMLGMEKAMFLPSGTMCNEIAIAVHCRPGDEVICTRDNHIIFAESGGPAALSGVMLYPIDTERGQLKTAQVAEAIRPRASHSPRSRLLCVEQTANLAGGAVWTADDLQAVRKVAQEAGLAAHIDGARILNAQVASGVPARAFSKGFDSGWVAFTKGLGCPVGAVLAGSKDFIQEAWIYKRRWGGAMRQTGVLAAMCLYALDNNVERLAEDHARARRIESELAGAPAVASILPVETNIVIVNLSDAVPDARTCAAWLKANHDVTVTVVGPNRIRLVTHMDVDDASVDALVRGISQLQQTKAA